jgi:hypothetical protein
LGLLTWDMFILVLLLGGIGTTTTGTYLVLSRRTKRDRTFGRQP